MGIHPLSGHEARPARLVMQRAGHLQTTTAHHGTRNHPPTPPPLLATGGHAPGSRPVRESAGTHRGQSSLGKWTTWFSPTVLRFKCDTRAGACQFRNGLPSVLALHQVTHHLHLGGTCTASHGRYPLRAASCALKHGAAVPRLLRCEFHAGHFARYAQSAPVAGADWHGAYHRPTWTRRHGPRVPRRG